MNQVMVKPTLQLTTRHFRQYKDPGLVDTVKELAVPRTGFISLHVMNVGWPDGPEYPAGRFAVLPIGSPEGNILAQKVVRKYIEPCLKAARRAKLHIFHVAPDLVANKYPISSLEWKPTDIPPYPRKWGNLPDDEDAEDPQSVHRSDDPEEHWCEAVPGWSLTRAELVHGPGYQDWDGYQEMDFVTICKPLDGEYVIKTTQQLDRLCRRLGVVNLVYAGFSAQGCIQFSPGAIYPMSARGYRCLLIREATLGTEFPDTTESMLMTKTAVRMVEQKFGLSIGADDFIRACQQAAD